ncbi:hypothetical protein M407DRAFT_246943 [Tulasnella calospora MUT 4182]|uniref:Uncharacterized protein n=1 Tax=Tulasnella calospora MUT 4182 TaxID=1051891 RepID=A0A0C3Q1V2_9AGAM|nr:hypothetical protein M407DRAFT_246943 [Tulasnella calospora MUT 4182]
MMRYPKQKGVELQKSQGVDRGPFRETDAHDQCAFTGTAYGPPANAPVNIEAITKLLAITS